VQDNDHRRHWQPPPRPEWVQRLIEEGDCMDIRAVVPLDENSLLASAMRSTGLSDFGDDDWREPFRILIKSLEEEAELHLMGRLWARSAIVILLESRLQIEETYKRHPEINDEEIKHPIFIVGQSRTGTSFLLNVLASIPENGVIMQWEATFPCPPPEKATYKTDPRIEKAHRIIDRWNRVTPTIKSMYEFSGYVPMEDCEVLSISFRDTSFLEGLGQVPSYDAYMRTQDFKIPLRYHQRVLKLLQWKNPRQQWVLKDPLHLDRIPTILEVYPDACIVWPHRDPVRALASVVDLIGTIQWQRTNHPFKGGGHDAVTDPNLCAARFNAVIDLIESGVIPRERIFHTHFKDHVGNTMATVEAMYKYFGLTLSDAGREGIAQFLKNHPRDARPAHKFGIGAPEAVASARKAYKRYQDYFNVESE
jgi:Sulfotransferase family